MSNDIQNIFIQYREKENFKKNFIRFLLMFSIGFLYKKKVKNVKKK